jgi:hypothetical protein
MEFLTVDAGPAACQACVSTMCSGQVTTCGGECQCNSSAIGALTCVESLGGNATASALASCVSDLSGASDPDLASLGGCLATCFGSCSASPPDAEAGCPTIDATASAIQTGSCGACLEASCPLAVSGCEADCTCSTTVVTALACLANLGASTSLASATACVAPVESTAFTDSALEAIGQCVVASCEPACGLAHEAGAPEASTPDGGGTDAGGPDVGSSDAAPTDAPADVAQSDVGAEAAPTPLTGVTAIAYNTTSAICALLSGGGVDCWGNMNTAASANPVATAIVGATAIAAGEYNICAVVSGGTVECTGLNDTGQLGNGSTSSAFTSTPVQVMNVTGATALAAGARFECALLSGGTVSCWGQDTFGQLGGPEDGGAYGSYSSTPMAVENVTTATAIAAGATHACALLANGTVACWGGNNSGQLGLGSTVYTSDAAVIPSLTGVTSLSASNQTTCVVSSGNVICWGEGLDDKFGGADSDGYAYTPTLVPGVTGATAVAVGGEHVCALLSNGTVSCWGDGAQGQLGDGVMHEGLVPTPVTASGLTTATAIAAANYSTCALLSNGTVACWGLDYSGGALLSPTIVDE